MLDDAKRLSLFNAKIRNATDQGAVEQMIVLIEERRQFLDTIAHSTASRSPDLIAVLGEAIRDNNDLVSGIEKEMALARKRGKDTLQARRRYHKTQINP
jgi:hypothetical protein